MIIKTNRGKTYDVDWIDTSMIGEKTLLLQMTDPRRLSIIAAEFDGLTLIDRRSETQGDKHWEGYTRLKTLVRNGEAVQIGLVKEREDA